MQSTVKLLFFLAVWKRPEITEICFMGLNRLKKLGKNPIESFTVISEESMIPLCEKYGVDWCMHQNLPLGAKKNYGLYQAMKKDFDYLIEIGSDDILKNEFLDLYPWDHDIFTLSDFVMVNTKDGECRRLTHHHAHFGGGRAISKKVIEALNGAIWTGYKNNGLDNNSTFYMARKGFLGKRVASGSPLIFGLKSDVNIWPFEAKGLPYPIENVFDGLSEEEVNAIQCLVQKNKSASLIDA